ncbi:MAG: hypothetical protein SV910_02530 [Chloroflexota bacterium]|nr:hypothetical protein [Chloroflexota bacterium]
METWDERIRHAVEQTEVLRFPRQHLATFGTTNINYYLLTMPVYAETVNADETVVREGKVSAERPRIVTPYYLTRLEGFGENAQRYLEMVIGAYGPHVPGLLYSYRNEQRELSIVSDRLDVVAGRLGDMIDKSGDSLAAVIQGVDELWDVSLLKFISELTEGSLQSNIAEFNRSGLLDIDHAGVPREARYRVEWLFQQVAKGECEPSELKRELDRWGLFPEYEDRFFKLFRRRQ